MARWSCGLRDGSFEPQLLKKNQTRSTGMDNQILSLYAKGMTTREIAAAFKELYDADVSPALVSTVTEVEWQNRPLDGVYPIGYPDCIVLKGFPDAVNAVYPQARIQLCIVHTVRNSLRLVSRKDYRAPTEKAVQQTPEAFADVWDSRYLQISRSGQANWGNPATFFAYPADIRKVICTTNAIGSLNSVIRHAVKQRKVSRR